MGSQHDDDHPASPPVHADGSGHAQMPVLGAGVQHNTFAGSQANADIVLVITHLQRCVEAVPGRATVFSLEITNRGDRARRLTLRPVGVPGSVCAITPGMVVVRPNESVSAKVSLQARAAVPEAGERELAVEAVDADTGAQNGTRWQSNRKRLRILARPDLTLNVAKPPTRDGTSTTYRTSVTVANTGNTRLAGTVQAPSALWIMTNTRVDPGRRFVDASLVRLPGEFELGPGTSAEIPLSVVFPDQPVTEQRWDLLLRVKADRSGIEDRMCSVPVLQLGQSDAPETATPPTAGPPPVEESWMSGRVAVPRVFLVLGFVAIVAAALAGSLVGERLHATPAVASTTPSPSSEVRIVATTPPAALDASSATAYTVMPCALGTWVVFLSSSGGSNADAEASTSMRYEAKRARYVDTKHTYQINASRWDDACPKAREYVGKKGGPAWRMVWIGPVQSEQSAKEVCALLQKPNKYDCLWRPTA
jgi:hypothetical protein